ncbi:hypothetical protein ON010_g16191 [Phytophthora cinnamomi]|nr:hypothetical protein ON010_g16191 [Phytophthora cinnamomi]
MHSVSYNAKSTSSVSFEAQERDRSQRAEQIRAGDRPNQVCTRADLRMTNQRSTQRADTKHKEKVSAHGAHSTRKKGPQVRHCEEPSRGPAACGERAE